MNLKELNNLENYFLVAIRKDAGNFKILTMCEGDNDANIPLLLLETKVFYEGCVYNYHKQRTKMIASSHKEQKKL